MKKVFNKSVSWVRVRDDHILTVDRVTFIADERFNAFHTRPTTIAGQQPTGWTLQIKYVQARDAGLYECQVSTEPKISARVNLHVVGKLLFKPFFFFLSFSVYLNLKFC